MLPEFAGIFTGIATVNKEMYIDIPHYLRDAFRRKNPEKWRTKSWFLLHDNAPAHWSVLFKDFLAKIKVTTMKHPSYSPDLAAAYFYLFPQLKSALKGWCFCDATDIIKNVTEELQRFSQNDFQECFQHL
jgi:transposase